MYLDNQFVRVIHITTIDLKFQTDFTKFLGDSGSSIGKFENERFVLYGVASFTSDSCLSGYPNGFTEIQPHMDFILKNFE